MSSRPSAARFQPTRWSLIAATRGSGEPARRALGELCATYWYPLYGFARRQGLASADAEEAVQSLFASLLEREDFGHVDPARGRFRSFLLAAFQHWLANERERARAWKRGGRVRIVSIDGMTAEQRYAIEPAHAATPEAAFDRAWASTLIDRALAALREEYASSGRGAVFEALHGALGAARGAEDLAGAAVHLGMSAGAVRTALHRLRSRYRAVLRGLAAETVAGEGDVEGELSALLGSIGKARAGAGDR